MTSPKIILHPGFHKTGTTYVQKFLLHNGPVLWPVTAMVFKNRLQDAIDAAKIYSYYPNPTARETFKGAVKKVLETLELGKKRSLIISAEGLSGVMPGRHGVVDYGASVDLHRALCECCTAVFGNARPVHVFYSTRQKEPWLRSAYWQTIRATFSTSDWDTFLDENSDMASLDETVAQARDVLRPHHVHSSPLEQAIDLPFGPTTPVIDLLGLDPNRRKDLQHIEDRNPSPPLDVVNACLQINRQGGDVRERQTAKTNLIRAWRGSQPQGTP